MTPILMVPTLQQTGGQINKEGRFRTSQDCEENKTGWQVGSDGQLLRRELGPELSLVEAARHAEVQGLKKSMEGNGLGRVSKGPTWVMHAEECLLRANGARPRSTPCKV